MERKAGHWAHTLQPYTLGLLRIVAALLFWQHSLLKLFGWFGGHVVPQYSLLWFAGVMESVLAPLLIIGFLTRPVAILLCGEMLIAYCTQHMPHGFWPIQNQGLPALQYWGIFVLLAAAGPGFLAVDGLRSAEKERRGLAGILHAGYPTALTVLRITTAFLFWQFGVRKMFGWLGGKGAAYPSKLWFAGVLEVFGAPLVALGAVTRPLTFLLSGEMAVAYWTSHYPRGQFWPIQNGGEPAVLFCFIYLFLATAGPGKLSVDARFRRHKSATDVPDREPVNSR